MKGGIVLSALRHDRVAVIGALAFVVVLAWAWLLLGAGMPAMDSGAGAMLAMQPGWSLHYAVVVFVMWIGMMAAMMLPAVAPVTLLVATIARKQAAGSGAAGIGTALFVAGYLAVWIGFSAAATALQWMLDKAGVLSSAMAVSSTALAGAVLVAVGLYQWTPLKAACLRHCRSPLDFILYHWRPDAIGAAASGVRHGVFCLGCCWMLMALLFVGGVMSVAWIALVAIFVLIEKTLPWGGQVSRAAGVALAAWGAATLASVF